MLLNRKGFTLVELIIVIAVIAILSVVMVTTMGSVVDNAQQSNQLKALSNSYSVFQSDMQKHENGLCDCDEADNKTFAKCDTILTNLTANLGKHAVKDRVIFVIDGTLGLAKVVFNDDGEVTNVYDNSASDSTTAYVPGFLKPASFETGGTAPFVSFSIASKVSVRGTNQGSFLAVDNTGKMVYAVIMQSDSKYWLYGADQQCKAVYKGSKWQAYEA